MCERAQGLRGADLLLKIISPTRAQEEKKKNHYDWDNNVYSIALNTFLTQLLFALLCPCIVDLRFTI